MLLKCAPGTGLDAAAQADETPRQSLELSRFNLAMRTVASAAKDCGIAIAHTAGGAGHRLVAGGTVNHVASWTATLLRCATRSLTGSPTSAAGGESCDSRSHRADTNLVCTSMYDAIDGPIGDIVAGLLATGVGEPALSELASAAQALVQAVLPRACAADLRLARRLWAALEPEDNPAGSDGADVDASELRVSDVESNGAEQVAGHSADMSSSSDGSKDTAPAAAASSSSADSSKSVHEQGNSEVGVAPAERHFGAQQSAAGHDRDRETRTDVAHPVRCASAAVGSAAELALQAMLRSSRVQHLVLERGSCATSTDRSQQSADADGGTRTSTAAQDEAASAMLRSASLPEACRGGAAGGPILPPDVAQQALPLHSLVQAAAPGASDVRPAAAADARCEALTLLEVRFLSAPRGASPAVLCSTTCGAHGPVHA